MGSRLIESHPLRIHALAGIYNWDEVAQASALRCLDHDPMTPETIAGLRGLSLEHYGRLLSLARRRHQCLREMLDDPHRFAGSNPDYLCKECDCPARDLTWKVLRMQILDSLSHCPSGAVIKQELDRGQEWTNAMSASHCGDIRLYQALATYKNIIAVIDALPTQLDAD